MFEKTYKNGLVYLAVKAGLLLAVWHILFFISFKTVYASTEVVSSSSQIKRPKAENTVDLRKKKLENFFKKYKSPLSEYSSQFISHADKNNIDWRLVPAISGVESTFAKRYPRGSFNAYGWANGEYKFKSWDHSIEVVSRSLRKKYYDRGATNIAKVAKRYAPPSSSWGWKVKYFMEKIDPIPAEFDL